MQTLSSSALRLPPRKPSPGATVDHLTAWRDLIQQGEAAFERGHDVHARQLYDEALSRAEALFDIALRGDDEEAVRRAPPVYSVSCTDIVTLARRQGDDATASIFLYRMYARLLSVTESRAPLAFRARCALFLDGAARELIQHLEHIGQRDLARAHHERARTAIDRVRRLQQMAVAQ
jgi:hypothetical protein